MIRSSSTRDTAARGIISGEISNGATWVEDLEITLDGTAIAGTPASWTWTLTLRDSCGATVLTLSTSASTLSISQGTESTVLQIRCPQSSLANLADNYDINIRSQDPSDTTVESGGKIVHWGHGSVVMLNEPPV